MTERRAWILFLGAIAAVLLLRLVFRVKIAILGAKYLLALLVLLIVVAALAGALSRRGKR